MPTKYVDGYEIEFSAERLIGAGDCGAFVAIFAKSNNPMHLENVHPKQRVASDVIFPDQHAAEAAAEKAGAEALGHFCKKLKEQ